MLVLVLVEGLGVPGVGVEIAQVDSGLLALEWVMLVPRRLMSRRLALVLKQLALSRQKNR